MSTENIAAFLATTKDNAALRDEVRQSRKDLAGIVAIGSREGYSFTVDELSAWLESRGTGSGRELSDEELENIAGGIF